ncbi:MAG: hypothetical protein KKC46_07680 [Proteobacteria bacterium]|nr:hypothetical protein [Pseudomonadota bacterium]
MTFLTYAIAGRYTACNSFPAVIDGLIKSTLTALSYLNTTQNRIYHDYKILHL